MKRWETVQIMYMFEKYSFNGYNLNNILDFPSFFLIYMCMHS